MAVFHSEARYRNYGKCLKIENAFIELWVTLDVGPRIIRYALKGGENVMYEDRLRKSRNSSKELQDYYGKGACWYIYGGHRIWVAPETLTGSYYPDNNKVSYTVDKNTFTFTPPAQTKNSIQMSLRVTIGDYENRVTVENIIKNVDCAPKTFSVWALSALAPGGIEIVPQNNHVTGFTENRHMALWDYSDMSDRRVSWGSGCFLVKQDKKREQPFKVGTDNRRGWAAYLLRGTLFLKQFDFTENADYPDGGMNFETYVCDRFIELESLSPLHTLNPGESASHIERWDLIDDVRTVRPGDFSAAEDVIKKHIEH